MVPHDGGGRWEFTILTEWGCVSSGGELQIGNAERSPPRCFKREGARGEEGREITKRPLEASTTCCHRRRHRCVIRRGILSLYIACICTRAATFPIDRLSLRFQRQSTYLGRRHFGKLQEAVFGKHTFDSLFVDTDVSRILINSECVIHCPTFFV